MSYQQNIVTYSQDKSVKNGLHLRALAPKNLKNGIIGLTHRDDYYILILVLEGTLQINCELQTNEIQKNELLIIKPYQIHTVEGFSDNFSAYFLSIQDFRIPDDLTYLFFNLPNTQQLVGLSAIQSTTLQETIDLLLTYQEQKEIFTAEITNGLFQAIIYNVGSLVKQNTVIPTNTLHLNQSNVITSRFKRLITTQTHLNQPSYFADLLFITPAHLNDCVKKTTGQTVSYWLKKSIIDEAKRLLYYTTKSVKEIAFELGYEDHTYFSRLFKKHVKQTPLQFRIDFTALIA